MVNLPCLSVCAKENYTLNGQAPLALDGDGAGVKHRKVPYHNQWCLRTSSSGKANPMRSTSAWKEFSFFFSLANVLNRGPGEIFGGDYQNRGVINRD